MKKLFLVSGILVLFSAICFAGEILTSVEPGEAQNSHGSFFIQPGNSGGDPDTGNTSVVINDPNVTAKSAIQIQYDASLGNCSGITYVPKAIVQSRVPGASFQVETDIAPINQPFCFTYQIVNK